MSPDSFSIVLFSQNMRIYNSSELSMVEYMREQKELQHLSGF